MAAPLAPLLPFLGKAVAFAKGLAGAKAATTVMSGGKLVPALVAKAKAFGSGQAAREVVKRMAGEKLAGVGSRFISTMPKTAGELGMRVAPDAIFGTLTGAMTPGDLGDKLIAGTTATIGGSAGGLVGRGVVGAAAPKLLNNQMVDITTEMVGGLGGDMAGQGVADALLRLKGGGTTPYEKMAAEQQQQLETEILRRYLSGKGGYPSDDYFLQQTGLG